MRSERVIIQDGFTTDETREVFPGDEIIPHPLKQRTQKIRFQNTAEEIYPQFIQWTCQRACWSTVEFNASVLPWLRQLVLYRSGYYLAWSKAWKPKYSRTALQFRDIKVGDVLPGDGRCKIVHINPRQTFVLHSVRNPFFDKAQAFTTPLQGNFVEFTWGTYLQGSSENVLNAILRVRANYRPEWLLASLVKLIMESADINLENTKFGHRLN